VGFLLNMTIHIYEEHCEFLEKENKKLKQEILFLREQLEYKTLGLPLTNDIEEDIV
jgi:cell division septum initiation protein DivIVA